MYLFLGFRAGCRLGLRGCGLSDEGIMGNKGRVFEDGLFKWSVWVKLMTGEARREAGAFS